jgi:hypothetical protein
MGIVVKLESVRAGIPPGCPSDAGKPTTAEQTALARALDGGAELISISAGRLAALRNWLKSRMQPTAAAAVACMLCDDFFPGFKANPDAYEDRKRFAELLSQDLESYPAWAVAAAIRQARRLDDWLPSNKRMIDLCNAAVQPFCDMLTGIDRMEAGHLKRRQQAAA